MSISVSTANALEEIARRSRDVMRAYEPGATPEFGDVANTAGQSVYTLDPLSVAAPDDAYFVTAGNGSQRRYTRDGEFAIRAGQLVDRSGRAILGFQRDDATLAPLRFDPIDRALRVTQDVRIDESGAVSYARPTVDPKSGIRSLERITVGKFALARFPAATKLAAGDAAGFAAPQGVVPHIGRAGDGNFGAVQTHRRAASGIDIDASLNRLQEAYLALDAIRAAHKAEGSVEKTAMDLLK